MQNEQTLIDIGFTKIASDEWLFRGKHQKFIAHEVASNGPAYISLSKIHPDIDNRPNSDRKGHHYISFIKNCCSIGSVERAIDKYDVPEELYSYQVGGCLVNTRSRLAKSEGGGE